MGLPPSPGSDDPAAADAYPQLRRPIRIGDLELPNRLVMAPMTTYGLPDADGSSNDRHLAYYERRASGGLGLLRVVSVMVHPSG